MKRMNFYVQCFRPRLFVAGFMYLSMSAVRKNSGCLVVVATFFNLFIAIKF